MGGKAPAWPGRMTYEAVLGPGSGLVQLGGYLVPRKVAALYEGEKGSPDLKARYEVRDGLPVCTEYSITAKPDGRPITAADLARFPVDVLGVQAVMFHNTPLDDPSPLNFLNPPTERQQWDIRRELESADRSARDRVTLAELKEVARMYNAHPEAPVQAVEKLGYSKRTATRRVAKAREAGLLDG